MEIIGLILKSLVIGLLCGFSVGALNARMFFAPEVMAAGAFRTLGEINACLGDPASHFSFGFSYMLSSWANNMAYGGMGQDFLHRTVPNVGAGVLLLKNKNVEETVYNPAKMALACGAVGAVLYCLMCSTSSFVPAFVTEKMMTVFTPVASNLLIIMQLLYLIACLDNGKYTATAGMIMGAISYLSTGNACAGLILGVLTGKTIEQNGFKSKISIIFIVLMVLIWGYISYARGMWDKAIPAFMQLSQLFQ